MPGLPPRCLPSTSPPLLSFFPLSPSQLFFFSSSFSVFFVGEVGKAAACVNASQEHHVPLLLADGPWLFIRLLSALFSDSDTCAIAMKQYAAQKPSREKLPERKDEREQK